MLCEMVFFSHLGIWVVQWCSDTVGKFKNLGYFFHCKGKAIPFLALTGPEGSKF